MVNEMVKVLKIDSLAPEDRAMNMAASLARFGKLVVFPTDTVYGLGTNPFNVLAVDRLLKVKGRLEEKGVPLLWLPSLLKRIIFRQSHRVTQSMALDNLLPLPRVA